MIHIVLSIDPLNENELGYVQLKQAKNRADFSCYCFSYQAPDVQVGLNSEYKVNRPKKQTNQTPTREFAAMRMGNKNRKRQKNNNKNVPGTGT